MKILVHTGIWCGDCVEQCPLIQRIAEVNPAKIDLRFVEREMNKELGEECASTVEAWSRRSIFSENDLWCATAGDRTLNRCRALALKRLGPSCPTGILPREKSEVGATLADWLNEPRLGRLAESVCDRLHAIRNDC